MDILHKFRGSPVLVVGDLMLDEFVWGQVSRISPEAPVPVVEVRKRTFVAGGAANTAANIASLGGRPVIAGIVGDDTSGDRVGELLTKSGVALDGVVRDGERPTTTKTRIVAHSQQLVRIDHESHAAIHTDRIDELLARIDDALPHVRACVISDYGKGVITAAVAQAVIVRCQAHAIPSVIDPKGTDYRKYSGATLVKPNLGEAAKALNREITDAAMLQQAGRDLIELLGGRTSLLITQGAQGMSLFERLRPMLHVPAAAREVYDVTGAGDTVAGVIALALAAGGNLEAGCRLASAAAAIVVGKAGTATVTWDELHAASAGALPRRQAA
jgi:D-beta-D-heptose 7-phosphate kinase/D-beta-D-heptose 1-phosphate adenosyltransferase